MTAYLVGRLAGTVPVLVVVTVVLFVSVRVLPGDLAAARLGNNANPEDVEELRRQLGLDRPLWAQYLDWMGGVLRGDPGRSLVTDLPVADQLWSRLPVTLELAVLGLGFAVVLGVPLGVVAAAFRGRAPDHAVRVAAVLGQAVPNFWLGSILLTTLSIAVQWTPPIEYRPPLEAPLANLQQFLLPAFAVGFALAAVVMRLTRSMMLDVLQQEYIRTARSKGLAEPVVLRRHALKNALIPVVTILGTHLGALLGGTVVIEQVFSLPGIGRSTLDAIFQRDYTQLQFNVLFLATAFVLLNLVVDLLYGYLDPRIRYH